MAGLLSPNIAQTMQTTTPQTGSGGGILSALGIGGSNAFGGGSVFPKQPVTASVTPPKANNPSNNISQPSTTIAPKYQAPTGTVSQSSIQSAAATNPNAFNFLPGESPQAYNSRIAALTAGQGGGQTGSAGGGQLGNAPQSGLATTYSQPQTQDQKGASITGATGIQASNGGYGSTNGGFLNQLMSNSGNNSQFNYDNTNLQNLKNQQADLENGIVAGDQPLYFKQGEMGQEQQAYQTKLAAAGQAVQNDIGEQNAQTTAATAGVTASLPANQNVQVPYNEQYLNGTTGQPVNPQAAQAMQSAVALELQKVQNNQESLATAQGNLSAYGQAGLNALNQGLGPNFNANTNAGTSAAQQSNTQVGGTAMTNANNSVYAQATSDLANVTNMQQNIQSFGSQLLNTMQQYGINPSSSQYANKTLNDLKSQFSTPQYAQFNTNIQGLQARIADLLSTGEIPSTGTAGAQAIANGDISLGAMQATLDQVNAEASAIVQNKANIASNAYTNVQGGGNTTSSNAGSFSDSSFYGT